MSEHNPPPWAWGIAGATITGLVVLLKNAVTYGLSSQSRENRDFQQRMIKDVEKLQKQMDKVEERLRIGEKDIAVLKSGGHDE